MSQHVHTRASDTTGDDGVGAPTDAAAVDVVTSRWSSEAGEGVISTAIAVLIMALLGAAMWVAFDQIFRDAAETTGEQIDTIGG